MLSSKQFGFKPFERRCLLKINVTYRIRVVDLGEDEEFGRMADEDKYFVISGLPTKYASDFWNAVTQIHGCSPRSSTQKDCRLRVNLNPFCDYEDFLKAKEAILRTIRNLIPDAQVRYRQLGSGLSEVGDYSEDDVMTLEGAFTDEERRYLSLDERAAVLGIERR